MPLPQSSMDAFRPTHPQQMSPLSLVIWGGKRFAWIFLGNPYQAVNFRVKRVFLFGQVLPQWKWHSRKGTTDDILVCFPSSFHQKPPLLPPRTLTPSQKNRLIKQLALPFMYSSKTYSNVNQSNPFGIISIHQPSWCINPKQRNRHCISPRCFMRGNPHIFQILKIVHGLPPPHITASESRSGHRGLQQVM